MQHTHQNLQRFRKTRDFESAQCCIFSKSSSVFAKLGILKVHHAVYSSNIATFCKLKTTAQFHILRCFVYCKFAGICVLNAKVIMFHHFFIYVEVSTLQLLMHFKIIMHVHINLHFSPLELWGIWITYSLPSLPGPLRSGVVIPDRVLAKGQIKLYCEFMLK